MTENANSISNGNKIEKNPSFIWFEVEVANGTINTSDFYNEEGEFDVDAMSDLIKARLLRRYEATIKWQNSYSKFRSNRLKLL